MNPFRRIPVPPEVREQVRASQGERVLARAESAEPAEGVLVATTLALYPPGGRRVPWDRIDRAHWDEDGFHFTEEGAGERVLPVASPGRFAETVHERVTATIVANAHVDLPGSADGSGFRLVARRSPGGSEVEWRIRMDEGVDPDGPGVRAAAAQALADLQERTGV